MSDGAVPTALPQDSSPAALHRRFQWAFRPRPWIYWLDMLGSAALGWAGFAVSVAAPFGSLLYCAATLVAVFALLRAALFIHELSHLRPGEIRGFETAWNLVFGIPTQTPSLMYVGSHMDHHMRALYGTAQDPEYAPIAHWSQAQKARFVLTGLLVPLMLVIRWGVLGPLSRAVPPLRRWVVERTSTLVINTDYRRPLPRGRHVTRWAVEEAAAALFVWAVAAGVVLGVVPLEIVLQFYVVSAGVWTTNQIRTLAAHAYENEGEPLDTEGQLLDSINLRPGNPVTALVAPVGLRYHALHHYLPGLPYHNLGAVHRQLLDELPDDSPYRRTLRSGLLEPLARLWSGRVELGRPDDVFSETRAARGL